MTKKKPVARLSDQAMLIQTARRITSLQAKRRRLVHDLKIVNEEIRLRKRELKAHAGAIAREREPMPPMRVYGESQKDGGR